MRLSVGRRRGRSPRDLALSLVVLLVPVFLFVGVYRLLGHEKPPVIDTGPAYQAASASGAFPVASPEPLPAKWRPLSSDFRPAGDQGPTLRVGLRAPGGGAVQLIESSHPADSLISAELGGGARPQGDVEVSGRSWQRYAAERGLRALVLLEPARTVIIIGTARDNEMRGLAQALA